MGCELDKVVKAINKVASEVRDPRAISQLNELKNDLSKFAISMETAKPTRDFSRLKSVMSNVEVKATDSISSNVKVVKLDDLKIKPVFSDAGVKTIRDFKTTEHFGNPFLSTRNFKDKGVGTDEEVAKMFSDWLKGFSNKDVEPKRREWIIKQILDGNLDNKPLLYYTNTPVNHAKELEKLIKNKSLLSSESSSKGPEVTNNDNTINIYSEDNNGFSNLSNFNAGPITIKGKEFPTLEHAFQYCKASKASKNGMKESNQKRIMNATSGRNAQKEGKTIPIDTNIWTEAESTRALETVMRRYYSSNEDAKKLLLSTGDKVLTHIGKNNIELDNRFPKILMKIRDELRAKNPITEVQSREVEVSTEFDEKLDKKIANKLKSIYKDIEVIYLNGQNEMRAVLEELGGDIALFQLSKKRKDEFEQKLRKARPDLDSIGVDKILNSIEEFSEVEANGNEKLMKKLELLALHWTIKGNVILPEDGSKVIQALRIAEKNKFDPFSYNNPNDITESFAKVEDKVKPLDPDMFLGRGYDNKQEWEGGITVYDVENSELGRKISRKMIDTHFGEDSNPWCLLARRNGSIESTSTYWFETYPGEKKIAFKNGKLVAFYGGDRWWDRMDNPFDGVPSERTGAVIGSDKDITELITVNENGVKSIVGYEKKGKKNSIKKWDENKNLILEKTEDGSEIIRREDGSISVLIKSIKVDNTKRQEEVTKFSVPDKNGKTFITEKSITTEILDFREEYFEEQDRVTYRYYENGQIKSIHDNLDDTSEYYDPEGNPIDYFDSIDIDNLVHYSYITFNEDGSVNGLDDVTRKQYVNDVENRTGPFASVDELPGMFNYNSFEIPFQKSNDIIKGAAVIDKRKILIDISSRSTDTLAHEYAHFYIAAFRDTPIVQEAIKKWGNEEALVQAIGEQVVSKKGAAYGFWKRFTKWVRDLVSNLDKATKEDLVKALTDAFLTNTNLIEYSNNSNKNTVNSKRKEGIIAPINSQIARDIQGCNK